MTEYELGQHAAEIAALRRDLTEIMGDVKRLVAADQRRLGAAAAISGVVGLVVSWLFKRFGGAP